MSDFDIRKAVRAVMDETDLASPEEIAEKVAGAVPGNRLRTVLAYVLRDFVRIELGRDRRSASAPPAGGSAKVRAIREAAPGWLRDRVYVGTGWTLFGDCTLDEVLYLVSERRENAARSNSRADYYEHVATEMKRHKAPRVADLPQRTLAALEADERRAA